MVTDQQYWRLMKFLRTENGLACAAAKAGMDEKTARKYRKLGTVPSQLKKRRTYRTRVDDFASVWSEIEELLLRDPGFEAVTLMEYLCQKYPDKFQMKQLRTLQRRMQKWKATEGPPKEVFFPQEHIAARQAQSDFTSMNSLGVTIAGQPFPHLFYHFTLTYSNWETGSICFSESFESLSEGLQSALWELGGVPQEHRTDNLSAAIIRVGKRDELTPVYRGLLEHYGLRASHTNPYSAHENGDVEQSHNRFKKAVAQSLSLRGSRDFSTREEYLGFLRTVLEKRNRWRKAKLKEELALLRPLPKARLEDFTLQRVRVTRNSTILIKKNIYSVPSQLIGEKVDVRIGAESLEVWFGNQKIESMPRLRGDNKHAINYRHVIHSLLRKPGAFGHYRYQQSLFPSLLFRVAYDQMRENYPSTADKQYLKLLELAATTSEEKVESVLRLLIEKGVLISFASVQDESRLPETKGCSVEELFQPARIELASYDALLGSVSIEEVQTQWSM